MLRVERHLLIHHNILLVRGMGGAGKTTFLQHLGSWWQGTGLINQVFYFGYNERPWTRQQLITTIVKQLFGDLVYRNDYRQFPLNVQQARLTQYLRAHRHLLIFDNLETITSSQMAIQHTFSPRGQKALHAFLSDLVGGKTLILLGSRSDEPWLAKDTFATNIYDLPGLDPEAASMLAERVLERHNATKYRQDEKLGDLIDLLDGFPLALEVVLANLARQIPSEVLTALQQGDVTLNVGTTQERTQNILRCLDYSHRNLSSISQQLLLCLAPFTSVLYLPMLEPYSNFLKKQSLLFSTPFDQWQEVIQEAENWGLLQTNPDFPGYCNFHPILPYFLRTHLYSPEHTDHRHAIETAFRQFYDQYGKVLFQMQQSQDVQERHTGYLLTSLEYENLVTALNIALDDQVSIQNPYKALWGYLYRADTSRGLALSQHVRKRLEAYDAEKLTGKLRDELALMSDRIAILQLALDDFAGAELSFRRRLTELEANKSYTGEEHFRKESAIIYSQLGDIALEQRKWEEAKNYHQQALQIFEERQDRYMQAGIYMKLGNGEHDQRKWEEAENYYQLALQIFEEYQNHYEQARVYEQFGIIASKLGEWERAENCYQWALQIFKEYNAKSEQAGVYHCLGNIASEQRKWEEAENYYQLALQIRVEQDAHDEQAIIYHSLGIATQDQGKWEEAENYYRLALQIYIEYQQRYEQAAIYRDLGRLAQAQEHWEKAENYCLQALSTYIEYQDRYEQARIYSRLGLVAQKQKKWEVAENYYQMALQVAVEYGNRYGQAEIYYELGEVAENQQKWQQARDYYLTALQPFLDFEDTPSRGPYSSSIVLQRLAFLWQATNDQTIPAAISPIIGISSEEVEKSLREMLEKQKDISG